MKKTTYTLSLLFFIVSSYCQKVCNEINLVTNMSKKYKYEVEYYTSGNKFISEYTILNIHNLQLRRIFIKNNTELNTIEIVVREDDNVVNNGSKLIDYIENERIILTDLNTKDPEQLYNYADYGFILFFENKNMQSLHLHSIKYNGQVINILEPLTDLIKFKNKQLITEFNTNEQNKKQIALQEEKIRIQDSIIAFNLLQEKQLVKQKIMDSINQVLSIIAEKQRIQKSINPDSIFLADLNENKILNYTLETKILEAIKNPSWQVRSYNNKMEIICDKYGKLKQLNIPNTENTIFKNYLNNVINDLELKPKSIENIEYNTRYIFPLELSKKNHYLKCIVKAKNNIVSKYNKNPIREELSTQILAKKNNNHRLWKGKYRLDYIKYKVNNDSSYKSTSFKIRDVYAIKIGVGVTSNYSILPTDINYEPFHFIIPQISILYRWIGAFYGYGINRAGGYFDKIYPIYNSTIQNDSKKYLITNTTYHEAGLYLQVASCFYLKGGITISNGSYIYKSGINIFNKTSFNEIGFLAGISIYPRYMHIDLGYNHTFKSIFATVGLNIPIKI